MHSIYQKYTGAKVKAVAEYIEEDIVDGNEPDKKGDKYIFLATNGSWQYKYISLYETLHDKYIAKYFAKLLLELYLEKNYDIINRIKAGLGTEEEKDDMIYHCVAFTKIVTVTISSQLLGVAMRNIIRDDDTYQFLRDRKESNRLRSCPKLLRLSSYYSFDEEKPFREIGLNDKVVIVNDVISTGSLVYSLIDKITKKKATIKTIFSIADTRIPSGSNVRIVGNEVREHPSVYGKPESESLFITLDKCDNERNEIKKYIRPYDGPNKVKRINPLLNTIVDLETRHSEERRILFADPSELFRSDIISDSDFKIGHFKQNLSHNGYLTDMHSVFSATEGDTKGSRLLEYITLRLNSFLKENQPCDTIFDTAIHNLDIIKGEHSSAKRAVELIKELNSELVSLKKAMTGRYEGYRPDFIFFPPFSGIEQLSESLLNECFGTPVENIICLQRFDTNKGWRFPFPAKWYNQLTRNKSVLILDSGSLTGESLVQLVDSIAFLDVKSILVLCILTRIEDFYREFYSRLKFIKVKQLSEHNPDNREAQLDEHIVPLTILFGINLHIPVFPSKSTCPFCEEIREINHYLEKATFSEPSEWTMNYLKNRTAELKEVNLEALEVIEPPYYLPTQRETGKIDSIEIFLMRDKIGKIDSYRFYKDYFYFFDLLKDDIDSAPGSGIYLPRNLKELELILTVIVHEPHLLRTVSDLLVDVYEYCAKLVMDVVFAALPKTLNELVYKWNEYAFARLAVVFFPKKFSHANAWLKLFSFSAGNNQGLNYLSFLLWECYLESSALLTANQFVDIMTLFSDNLDKADEHSLPPYNTTEFRKIIKGLANKFRTTKVRSLNAAFFNLRVFFFGQTTSNTHNAFIRAITRYESIIKNVEKLDDDFSNLFALIEVISNYLFIGILENLNYIKANERYKKYQGLQYQTLFNADGVCEKLVHLLDSMEEINIEKQKIKFQSDFSKLGILYEKINSFYINYLHETANFNNFCREYKADFLSILMTEMSVNGSIYKTNTEIKKIFICHHDVTVVRSSEEKYSAIKNILKFNKFEENDVIYLSITKSMLAEAIDEIFVNALKHTSGNAVYIDLVFEKNDAGVVVFFKQRQKRGNIQNPVAVKEILGAFCGDENIRFYDEDNSFIIQADFKTENLNKSNNE